MTRRDALHFVNVAHFFDHFFLLIFPTAALAIARAWGMGYSEILVLGTPLYVMFALGTLPAGWLGDRFDRMKLLALFYFGCGASSLCIAFSPGPNALMIGLGFLGLFTSLYHPVGLALVTDLGERTGRALAVNGVFGNMGLAGAAAITGVLATQFGWHSAFAVPGLTSLVVGCVLFLRRRNVPSHSASQTTEAEIDAVPTERRTQLVVVAVVLVAALFGGFVFNAVTISLPKFFDERLISAAGNLSWTGASTGLVFTVAAFAQLPVGELLDRFGARPILFFLLSVQVILLACLSQVTGWIAFGFALVLVTMMFAEIPITTWLISRYIRSGLRSRVVSVEYVLSLGMASAAVPLIAGMHASGLGFDVQFAVLAASAGVVFCAALFLPREPTQVAALSTYAAE